MLVGIDIVEIARIQAAVIKRRRFLERVFTPQEIAYCMAKKHPYPSLAVRFAAKEAVRKLHPVFINGVRFHDVEVVMGKDGRPELVLHPELKQRALGVKIKNLALSLSHSKSEAIAVVIAEEE